MLAASGAARSAWNASQQAPSRQLVENTPGRPRSPSRAIQRTVRSTRGETARPSTTGEPSIARPHTSSGWRTASTRASVPPRLCPTSATGEPHSAAKSASCASRRSTERPAQSTLANMPLIATRCPRRRSHARSTRSDASPAMNPGISITGGASASGRGARRRVSESSRASSAL